MTTEIDLWVCPHCHVLQGIETVIHENNVIICNCLSCGIQLKFEDVNFLNEDLVRNAITYIQDLLPSEIVPQVRYSWVSNKTLGLIFDYAREDLQEFGIDPDEFEDSLEMTLGINITLFYEF